MDQSDKHHVVVIPSWYPPYGGSFFREHAMALARYGQMDVTVLARHMPGLKNGPLRWLMPFQGKTVSKPEAGLTEKINWLRRIPLADKKNTERWVNCIVADFKRHLQHNPKPSLVQAQSSMWAGLAAAEIKKKWGVPYVLTEHRGRFVSGKDGNLLIMHWHRPLLHTAFSNASHILTVSRSLQPGILEVVPEKATQMSVIPNMVDTSFFTPGAEESKNAKFTFLCIAHLERHKGLHTLIMAFADLAKSMVDSPQLIIAGDGSLGKELRTMVKDLGVEKQITFKGKLDKTAIRELLWQSNALVVASLFESFGVVIAEAMACGIPVVATPSGGPQEIITPQTGLVSESHDVCSLKNTLQHFMEAYPGYDKETIRAYALDMFGQKNTIQKYIALYRQIIQSTP